MQLSNKKRKVVIDTKKKVREVDNLMPIMWDSDPEILSKSWDSVNLN